MISGTAEGLGDRHRAQHRASGQGRNQSIRKSCTEDPEPSLSWRAQGVPYALPSLPVTAASDRAREARTSVPCGLPIPGFMR